MAKLPAWMISVAAICDNRKMRNGDLRGQICATVNVEAQRQAQIVWIAVVAFGRILEGNAAFAMFFLGVEPSRSVARTICIVCSGDDGTRGPHDRQVRVEDGDLYHCSSISLARDPNCR
jgi:hypothetical protein